MENSKISWTDNTFSPWWGCTRVSPGCAQCYAAELGNRFGVQWGKGQARRLSSEAVWSGPEKWNRKAEKAGKRVRVFCGSMCDWADDEVPLEWRIRLWNLVRRTPWIDWLMLTKRAENVPSMLPPDWGEGWHHVQLGFTAENQLQYDRRIEIIERVPAWRRFVSAEPLLGFIDLGLGNWERRIRIHQVIAGGESGRGARPMYPDWARSLRDQSVAAGVAFHFKQWGEWGPVTYDTARGIVHETLPTYSTDSFEIVALDDSRFLSGPKLGKIGKKAAGRILDGREWNENPPPVGWNHG